MLLVLDANILFASFIKEGMTAALLFDSNLEVYAPEFIIEEFMKYASTIEQKTKRTREEFVGIMHALQEIITIIPEQEYASHMDEAKDISPDDKDTMYLALALKMNCAVWSNDAKLKEQQRVKIYNTREIMEILRTR